MNGKIIFRYIIVIVVDILLTVDAFRAKGYIVHVQSDCGYDQSGEWVAGVTVLADITASATGLCEGRNVDFTSTTKLSHQTLLVYYGEPADDGKCYFRRVFGLYRIDVVVAIGDETGIVELPAERYTVTCTKFGTESKGTQEKVVAPALISPKELQTNKGTAGSEMIIMAVVDTQNSPILRAITFGDKVKLKAAIRRGLTYGQGFKVVSCDAVGTEDQAKYAILRGGCGDGVVIPSTKGFISDGYFTVTSPVFKMFQIIGSRSVVFKCNFTICSEKCMGTVRRVSSTSTLDSTSVT